MPTPSFRSAIRLLLITTSLFTLTACINLFTDDPGRRTPGVVVDDNALENVVESEIRNSNTAFSGSHLAIVAYNGVVLLTGQVPSAELKEQASTVTQGLRRVKRVHNELSVGGPTSFFARTNDTWLTSKVKTRLLAAEEVVGSKIKVQTENGIVYLLGLLTREQADQAVDVAKDVYGVQKIVKVFEYLD